MNELPLRKRHGRYWLFAAMLFVATVFFAYFSFVYFPQRQELAALAAKTAELRTRTGLLRNFSERHPDLSLYRRQLAARLAQITALLPPATADEAHSDWLAAVHAQAAQNGVTLDSLAVLPAEQNSPPEPAETSEKLPPGIVADRYDIIATGNYFALLGFLHSLEESGRLIALERWSLKRLDESGRNLKLELRLAAYSQMR